MDKFREKYRIETARLTSRNYGGEGLYFVTICTILREHYFGEIENGKMHLSEIGRITEEEWLRTFDKRPDMRLIKDVFVVMPNHFHAIIGIGSNYHNNDDVYGFQKDLINRKHTIKDKSFGPQYKNLPSIIRGFKSAVSSSAKKNKITFGWQPRYHDHVIRDDEYERIRLYILNNPLTWENDIFNQPSNVETH